MAASSAFLSGASAHERGVTELLRDLVRTPSPSAGERDVVTRLIAQMEALDYDEVVLDPFGSVIGRIGPADGTTTIVMDAHIDTVGVGSRTEWSQDPFEPVLRDGVVYGRGACDDKGGMAAMVYGGALARETGGLPPDVTLYVVGSVQEEDCDGLALEHVLTKVLPRPDVVVLGEATNGQLFRGHRGRIEVLVRTRGSSCHASAPDRGHNPVYDLAPVIAEIEALNARLGHDEFLGAGTIALTKIECETPSLNAVPANATLYLDRRLTLGEDPDAALKEIAALPSVQRVGGTVELLTYERASFTGTTLGQDKRFATWVVPEDSPAVQAGLAAIGTALGRHPTGTGHWVFSTNGVASMGKLGIPTVGYGPGDERYAHTVADQCPVRDLVDAMAFYAAVPAAFVGAGR
ncbi:MAG: YgeY family selenium metabolism-linked hydrolase [Acidimicrobiales bacterium]